MMNNNHSFTLSPFHFPDGIPPLEAIQQDFRTWVLPRDQALLYLQDVDSPGCPGLIHSLQCQGCQIHSIPIKFDSINHSMLERISVEIIRLEITSIALPHHDDPREAIAAIHSHLRKFLENFNSKNLVLTFFEYSTPFVGASRINLVCPVTNENQKIRAKAASQYVSQMERLRFDLAAQISTDAAAKSFKIRHPKTSEPINSLECFNIAAIIQGEEYPLNGKYSFGSVSLKEWKTLSLCNDGMLFLAPHYDDAELGAPALILESLSQECRVNLVYMVTGYNAVMKDHAGQLIEADDVRTKTIRRELETQHSAAVMGLKEPIRYLRQGFYDREIAVNGLTGSRTTEEGYLVYRFSNWITRNTESPDYHAKGRYEITASIDPEKNNKEVYLIQSQLGRRWVTRDDIQEVYLLALETYKKSVEEKQHGPLVIVIPDSSDQHPDHLATRFIGQEVARRVSSDQDKPVLVISYLAPWAGEFNGYLLNTPEDNPAIEQTLSEVPVEQQAWYRASTAANSFIALELATKGGMGTTAYLGVQSMERYLCTVYEKSKSFHFPVDGGPFIMVCQPNN